MNKKNWFDLSALVCIMMLSFVAACSHKKATPDQASDSSQQQPTPLPVATPFEAVAIPEDQCPPGGCSKANLHEYVNTQVLPKIRQVNAINECFVTVKRATQKELEPGNGLFVFEARLVAVDGQVKIQKMRFKSYSNIPEWALPCLARAYEKLRFPPFQDPKFRETSTTGTISVDWRQY